MRWRRRWKEEELDDEIRAHLDIEARQRTEAGESPQQAEQSARRAFGSVALVKEVTRSTWGYGWLESLLQDLKYAGRGMRRAPGFTAVAVMILALGIGANTVIFSMVDRALLSPLPFAESDRLVRIYSTKNGVSLGGPSVPDMRDFAAAARSFEGMVPYDRWRKNVGGLGGSNAAEPAVVGLVPRSYFDLLRISPIIGRLFSESENVYGRHYVAIISTVFWQTHFAADPNILGKTLHINGEPYSIIGVVPDVVPGWMDQTTAPVRIWTPFVSENMWPEAERGARGDYALGRLKPGVSLEQARSELTGIAARLAREYPVDQGIGVAVEPLADTRAGPVRPILLLLGGAVAMVLIIACANLASLLLARNSARSREMAIRAALGAGRARLVRQLLMEALVLSLAGSLAGLGLAWGSGVVLAAIAVPAAETRLTASNFLGQFQPASVDPRILLFTLAISLLTALLFGLAPAFTGARASVADTLREAGRSGTAGIGRQRFRRVLVAGEIALSLILVFSAGVLAQAMARLQQRDPGFRTDHLLIAHFYVPPARYPDNDALSRFCDTFAGQVRAIPGVVDATVNTGYPPSLGWLQMFTISGQPVSRAADVPVTRFAAVDSHYLETLGLPLVSGRDFADSDTAASQPVAIVNQEFVRRYFPEGNPIGRQIHPGPPPGIPASSLQNFGGETRGLTIVGVVRDFMNRGVALPPVPQLLTLFRQLPGVNFGFKDIVVRTAADPLGMAPAIARRLKALDADMPLSEIRDMETHMRNQTADTRFTTALLALFAGLGTILAVIGAYGVVAYLVAQRQQEIGVRLALGAAPRDILWLVLRSGVFMGLSGVALGLAGTGLARMMLARLIPGATESDSLVLTGAAILLLVVVALASAIPAKRAMRVDPVQALRAE